MSALTDLFTSLANKIRSKLGTTSKYTPAQAISAIDDVYDKGVQDGTVPTQTKSAAPSTSAQTITPDSGYHLSGVSISAISPQNTAGTAAHSAGRDSAGAYVYFPYGWYPQYNGNYCYIRPTDAQAQAMHAHTGTYTFAANDTGGTKDLGSIHGYRYVNASNVYNKGVADARAQFLSPGYMTYGELGQGAVNWSKVYKNVSLAFTTEKNEMLALGSVVGFTTFTITVNGGFVFDLWGINTSATVTHIGDAYMSTSGSKSYTISGYQYVIFMGWEIGSGTRTCTLAIS